MISCCPKCVVERDNGTGKLHELLYVYGKPETAQCLVHGFMPMVEIIELGKKINEERNAA